MKTIHVDVFSGNMMQMWHSVVLNFVQGSGHENEDSLTALGEGHSGNIWVHVSHWRFDPGAI